MPAKKGMHLFVVATVVEGINEDDMFGNILLITADEKQAYTLMAKVNNRDPLPTIKYELLPEFKEAVIMTFGLGEIVTIKD